MQYPIDFTDNLRKKPICGVLSIAVIAGCTFADATNAVKKNLMPHQKRHGGKTYHEQRLGALRHLGVNFIEHKNVAKRNLSSWVALNAMPGVTYMVTTSIHVVTVRDGFVIDQYEHAYIGVHSARRCFVRKVVEIC